MGKLSKYNGRGHVFVHGARGEEYEQKSESFNKQRINTPCSLWLTCYFFSTDLAFCCRNKKLQSDSSPYRPYIRSVNKPLTSPGPSNLGHKLS